MREEALQDSPEQRVLISERLPTPMKLPTFAMRPSHALTLLRSSLVIIAVVALQLPGSAIQRLDFGSNSVSGIIVEANSDRPAADIDVILRRHDTSAVASATTDSHGAFAFMNIDPGEYVVHSRTDYFDDMSVRVTLHGTRPSYIDQPINARPPRFSPPDRQAFPKHLELFYGTDRPPRGDGMGYAAGLSDSGAIRIGTFGVDIDSPASLRALETGSSISKAAPTAFPIFTAKRVLVFVPGFSVSFATAAARAAKIAVCLPRRDDNGQEFSVALFSWGSRDSQWPDDYWEDRQKTEVAGKDLARFLNWLLVKRLNVSVFAHSMGSEVTKNAIIDLVKNADNGASVPDVALAAPDVSLADLERARDAFRKARTHLTVYTSGNDQALWIADRMRAPLGALRVLEGGRRILDAVGADPTRVGRIMNAIGPGGTVDVVDASNLPVVDRFGHDYYTSRVFLEDLVESLSASRPHPYGHEIELTGRPNVWTLKADETESTCLPNY